MQQNLINELIERNKQLKYNISILNEQIDVLQRLLATSQQQHTSISPRVAARLKVEEARKNEEAKRDEEARKADAARKAKPASERVNPLANMRLPTSSGSSSGSSRDSDFEKKYLKYKNKYQKLKKYM